MVFSEKAMVESAVEKSTEAVRETVWESGGNRILLDSRLALFDEKERWLAVSDLHFGYEVSRRECGGLWPMWGRETVVARLLELIDDYQPGCLILNGDIVDGTAASGEAVDWLKSLEEKCPEVVLIRGNHDRGPVVRELSFVPEFAAGEFLFHHGHRSCSGRRKDQIEVVGHFHPAIRFSDGAGLSMKLPCLIQETGRWIMPAFSPWAGGGKVEGSDSADCWACGPKRIFRCPKSLVTSRDSSG